MLGGIGKDAGATAAKEIHDAVDGAIPAAQQAVERVEDKATNSLAALIADVYNRVNGAALPVDLTLNISAITLTLKGSIGPLKLGAIDYGITTDKPAAEVKG